MNDQSVIISSLAMDLKRAALGIYNKSEKTTNRFMLEAKKRKNEIDSKKVDPYIARLLNKIKIKVNNRFSEDALMYSTLLQNYVISRRSNSK